MNKHLEALDLDDDNLDMQINTHDYFGNKTSFGKEAV
jgi:hypothetical protein